MGGGCLGYNIKGKKDCYRNFKDNLGESVAALNGEMKHIRT